jgi:hypothetical protein
MKNSVYNSNLFGGVSLIYEEGLPDGYLLLSKSRTIGNKKEGFLIVDSYYWYQPLYNNGNKVAHVDRTDSKIPIYLQQNVDKNGCWFCKATPYVIPTSNCVMIDNEEKFIGGWHP